MGCSKRTPFSKVLTRYRERGELCLRWTVLWLKGVVPFDNSRISILSTLSPRPPEASRVRREFLPRGWSVQARAPTHSITSRFLRERALDFLDNLAEQKSTTPSKKNFRLALVESMDMSPRSLSKGSPHPKPFYHLPILPPSSTVTYLILGQCLA